MELGGQGQGWGPSEKYLTVVTNCFVDIFRGTVNPYDWGKRLSAPPGLLRTYFLKVRGDKTLFFPVLREPHWAASCVIFTFLQRKPCSPLPMSAPVPSDGI